MTAWPQMRLVLGVAATLSLAAAAPAWALAPLATTLPDVRTHPAPPLAFDPLTASPESLQANGFPPRPDQTRAPRAFEHWRRAVTSGARRVFPRLVRTRVRHRPWIPRGMGKGTAYSGNWSGYALVNGVGGYGSASFYFVMGDFVVPRAEQAFGACTGGWDYAAIWVGIDGYGSADVLQAGTDADAFCGSGGNATSYAAWFEWYPNYEVEISGFPVTQGDDMFFEVWNVSPTVGGVYLVDYNSNQSASFEIYAPPGTALVGNSAEWVVERPGVGDSEPPLANYIEDFFESGYSGNFLSQVFEPGAPGAGMAMVPIVMLDGAGAAISTPSLLGATGLWFSDANSARYAGSP